MAAMEVAKVARGELEYKVCPCPKSIFREAKFVFPFMQKNEALAEASLLVIPTCQKALHDLVKVGPEIEEEKDRLLLAMADPQPNVLKHESTMFPSSSTRI